ncbi:DNA double-strand break repair nuclease NurA (plasmid) [Pontibacillus sp. ALD_SL1]|uniref:DNA double-strand break repair nuclease NurA n=1 Tax=Pontibacillus sp. ALD_SL1 TaxID=2777185 RepID=UPI001A96B6C5|nr:DNA double-strand break repair nuclease NurA [Pontibacillus sp. ALD_SL1]QST02911.1 DNA double-strand break repair nuclease NurA [Pontibacillus sp. ALD_SL1]
MHTDPHSFQTALTGVQYMLRDQRKQETRSFAFTPFKASNHPCRLAAVDGSNHDRKGMNFLFSSLRSGYLLYEKGNLVEHSIDPIVVEFLAHNDDPVIGYGARHSTYFTTVTGSAPSRTLQFDKISDHIRTLLEWQKIAHLVDKLDRGDLIIFDGSLISGEISTNHDFFESLAKNAKSKGISLIGLSKDTGLSIGSAPILPVLQKARKVQHPNQNWYTYIEEHDTYFVQFSKNKELLFRVDVVKPDDIAFETVISWVGSYCFDPPTFGYPYPMQHIHDAVRISKTDFDLCFRQFKKGCLENGFTQESFEMLFSRYHDQLDKLSFGR